MRWTVMSLVLSAVALSAWASASAEEAKEPEGDKAVALFNGENLDGWEIHLVDPDVKIEDVWSVADGVLVCKGEPLGYLATKDSFKNFRLVLEWRRARSRATAACCCASPVRRSASCPSASSRN